MFRGDNMLDGFWTYMLMFVLIMIGGSILALSLVYACNLTDKIMDAKHKYEDLMSEGLKSEARKYRRKQFLLTFLFIFIIVFWIFAITLFITISANGGGK